MLNNRSLGSPDPHRLDDQLMNEEPLFTQAIDLDTHELDVIGEEPHDLTALAVKPFVCGLVVTTQHRHMLADSHCCSVDVFTNDHGA